MEKGGSFIFFQHELQIDPFLAHFDGSGEETAQRPLLSLFVTNIKKPNVNNKL